MLKQTQQIIDLQSWLPKACNQHGDIVANCVIIGAYLSATDGGNRGNYKEFFNRASL